jgi:hypothetical protein
MSRKRDDLPVRPGVVLIDLIMARRRWLKNGGVLNLHWGRKAFNERIFSRTDILHVNGVFIKIRRVLEREPENIRAR